MLELGGNDPIIVMEDADLDEAAALAAAGSYKNSRPALHGGQAHARARERSPTRFVELPGREDAAPGRYGDPMDPTLDMGTVIDEAGARSSSRRA